MVVDENILFNPFSGVILRDSHGVSQVKLVFENNISRYLKVVSGNKILRIMRALGLAPSLPEDLYCLIKKAVSIRKHLERNR